MCPYCHRGKFLRAPREDTQQVIQQTVIVQQPQPEMKYSEKYCQNCGAKLSKNASFCEMCGSEIKS